MNDVHNSKATPRTMRPPVQQASGRTWPVTRLSAWLVAASLSLAACGGGGGSGGGAIDTGGGGAGTGGSSTPMQSLVVPESMTWQTAQPQQLQLSVVRDADGSAVADAVVSLFILTRIGPTGEVLAEPVALSLLETASTGADGQVVFSSQVPAHLTEVLLVVSAGALSLRQVVPTNELSQMLTVRLAP